MKKVTIFYCLILVMFSGRYFGQGIIVSNFTACTSQTVSVTPIWNNVSNISYFLTLPGNAPIQIAIPFTISSPTVGNATYTLTGNGTANSGTVTSTVLFVLTASAPPPLTFTNTNNYCFGSNANFTTTIGASNYNVTGGCAGNLNSTSNIISLNNLTSSCAGIYSVSATINGCARTGTTQINVAPNSQIAVSPPITACQYSNITLTAAMPSNSGFQWLDQNNNAIGVPPNSSLGLSSLTPTNSGVYTVTTNIVYNSILCPVSATTSVQVVVINQVNATASPANIVCQGTPLNLNAVAAQATSFSWFGPLSFFSTSQSPNILVSSPSNNGNYTVTAFFGGGSACSSSAVINVSVVPVSQPIISIPSSVCELAPSGVTMTVSAGPSALGYTWTGPCVQGAQGQAANIPTVVTNCSGIYYATAKFQIGNTICLTTASAALNVVPVNTITVVPPAPVCIPDNSFLQSNAPGANSYIWTGPNNFVNPGANVIVYNPNLTYNGIYTVTAFFTGGNITCSKTNTVQMVVNPVLNFTLDPHQLVCYNTPVTLTGPTGATSYTWTSSTGFTSNSKDLFFNSIQTKDAGTYTLNINYGPCKTSDDIDLEVLDPISFSLSPVDKTICLGDTLFLEGAVQGGSQNYAYTWNPPIYMDSPNGNIKTVVPQGSVLYNLNVHDIACPSFFISTTCSITVNPPSIPKLELTPGRGCAPLIMHYDTKIPAGEAIVTYDFGGNEVIQKDNFDYALKNAGIYNLKVYTKNRTNGCSNLYTYPVPIVVEPRPGSDFNVSPERPTSADRVVFTPSSAYDPIIRYSWQFEGGVNLLDTSKTAGIGAGNDSSSIMRPERLYNVAGNYRTMLITENDRGCIDTVYKVISIIDDLNIFVPNSFTPNGDGINDVFFVKGMGIKLENFSLQIMDRWGIIVYESKDVNMGWDGTVKGAPARDGVYTCFIKAVGMNGEGRKELTTHLNVIK